MAPWIYGVIVPPVLSLLLSFPFASSAKGDQRVVGESGSGRPDLLLLPGVFPH